MQAGKHRQAGKKEQSQICREENVDKAKEVKARQADRLTHIGRQAVRSRQGRKSR
jgi:hypothetical protein